MDLKGVILVYLFSGNNGIPDIEYIYLSAGPSVFHTHCFGYLSF